MFLFLGPSISSGGDNHRVTELQGSHECTFERFCKQCQVHNLVFVSTEYKIFKSILAFHVFGNKLSGFFNIPSSYNDLTLTTFLLKRIHNKKNLFAFLSSLHCQNLFWFANTLDLLPYCFIISLVILTTQMSHQPLRKWHAFDTSFFPSLFFR